MRSAMWVPISVGATTIGAMTLVSTESRRRFGEADLLLAEELGRRAGVATENARAFEERSALAELLQRDLLPPELPAIPGWRTAAMYRPAAGQVGGDFYDAIALDGGWLLIVGDVAGRGPEAASLTAMARYTL